MNRKNQFGWTVTEIVALLVIGIITLIALYDLVKDIWFSA